MEERSFESLKLKRIYDSDDCNDDPLFIVNTFLTPCMSLSRSYSRITGFFSSSSLAIASQGIAALIQNDGVMRIITSPRLSKDDVNAIIAGEKREDDVISDRLIEEITPDFIENESLEALGWMIAHDRLEIRIVVLTDPEGNIIPCNETNGMFHSKLGIFEDRDGNIISYVGSVNESASGWSRNIEFFTVFCDWISDEQFKYTQDTVDLFEKYWNLGYHKRSKTITFPDAVKNKWIVNRIPEKIENLKIFSKSGIHIRPYQEEAIQNWIANLYIGIFSMATGTGKTITALLALKKVLSEKRKAIVVIVVPFQHLINDPWESTISKIIPDDNRKLHIIHAFDDSNKWLKDAKKASLYFDYNAIDNIVYLTTYNTFSSEKFIDHIQSIKSIPGECDKILIADEVHYAGSDVFRKGLLQCYNMRLGLSATPSRYLDDDGTSYITSYFDKVVYDFPLERAINEINPDTGESYLTPYYYYPIFVTLNSKEISKYNEYTISISRFSDIEKLTPQELKYRENLLIQRSRIIKNAENKIKTLKAELPKYSEKGLLDHCIIYCSDGRDEENDLRSVESIIDCLVNQNIRCHQFTSKEDYSERSQILSGFDSGEYKVLVAIKCLDEGVDVPSTKNAFIMASTGNPKEYIQRRGRVLRRSPGKEFANIFDFVILPNEPFIDPDSEIQIFENESKRFIEFAKYSLNKTDNYTKLAEYCSKYNLVFKDDE